MQLIEQLEFDQKISKYFKGGNKEVKESDDWIYVINSYFLKDELVNQEQLLSPKISEQLESEGFFDNDGLEERKMPSRLEQSLFE
jgi:hypothetical protein